MERKAAERKQRAEERAAEAATDDQLAEQKVQPIRTKTNARYQVNAIRS